MALETFSEKVLRHIKRGEFDPETIRRGLKQAKSLLVTFSQRKGSLRYKENFSNFLGIEDLSVADYIFKKDKNDERSKLRIYDFPLRSKIQPYIFTDKKRTLQKWRTFLMM